MFHNILNFFPVIIQAFIINIFYGNDYNRRKFIYANKLNIFLFIDRFNDLGKKILIDGIYEEQTLRIIQKYLKKDSIFFDVGANEGYFSLISSKINYKGFNYLFEPQSRLSKIIKINHKKNYFKNFKLIKSALGDNNYKKNLNLFPILNTGASSFIQKYRFFSMKENVKIITLDEFLLKNPKIKKIDFIKIDVEGFEINVIKGMNSTLLNKKIKIILIDYHMNIISLKEKNRCEKTILSYGYKKIMEKYNDYTLYKLH